MDIKLLELIVSIIQFVFTAGIGFYVYISNQDKVTNDRITVLESDVDTRIDQHSERIARLEEAVDHFPTHEDLGELHTRINDVAKGVNTLTGEVKGIQNTLTLIHQYLLTGSAK
ncbi:MAG: DUF2730 family protein [Burkholderia gladioli]